MHSPDSPPTTRSPLPNGARGHGTATHRAGVANFVSGRAELRSWRSNWKLPVLEATPMRNLQPGLQLQRQQAATPPTASWRQSTRRC